MQGNIQLMRAWRDVMAQIQILMTFPIILHKLDCGATRHDAPHHNDESYHDATQHNDAFTIQLQFFLIKAYSREPRLFLFLVLNLSSHGRRVG